MKNYFILLLVMGVQCLDKETEKDLNKVLVDPTTGLLLHPKPIIHPTSKPLLHEPGVPPVITATGSVTQEKPLLQHTTEKPTTTIKPMQSQNNNNNPFTWIGNLFGIHNKNFHHKLPSYLTESGFNISDTTEMYSDSLYGVHVQVLEENNSTDMNLTSQPIILQNWTHPGISPPEAVINEPNKGVVDWVLGLVGIQTGNNGNNKPTDTSKPHETTKKCVGCSCGVTFKHTRIVGGIETQVNAYPWMTILTYNGRFYCGATVINNKYVITATHCVNGFTKERLEAVFLDHDRSSQFESKTFKRKIAAILKHRGYNMGGSYNNDVALLRLDQELPFNGLLRPVCLPSVGKSYTGYTGIATGWGATEEHGQVSNKLREVEVPIYSNIECRKTGYGTKITDNMMCAGYKKGMKDSCQGDSGGPLHIVNGSYHTIVGIVSWGEGCAEANYPGVYTRVNRYISWIKSNTKDACYCT